jgi:hypothetical protein
LQSITAAHVYEVLDLAPTTRVGLKVVLGNRVLEIGCEFYAFLICGARLGKAVIEIPGQDSLRRLPNSRKPDYLDITHIVGEAGRKTMPGEQPERRSAAYNALEVRRSVAKLAWLEKVILFEITCSKVSPHYRFESSSPGPGYVNEKEYPSHGSFLVNAPGAAEIS